MRQMAGQGTQIAVRVEDFAEPAMRRAPIDASEVAGLSEILNSDGDLRTLPCHLPHEDPRLGGLDGFYAARLVKS